MKKKLTIFFLILTLGVGTTTLLTMPAAAAGDPAEDRQAPTSWFEALLSILGMDDSSGDGEEETCEEEECERGGGIDPD